MSHLTDFLEQFHCFETTHVLFREQCLGIPYWDYVRVPIYEIMVSQKQLRPELAQPSALFPVAKWRTVVRDLWYLGRYLWWQIRHWRQRKARYDFCFFDVANRRWIDGKLVNIINYPLIQRFHRQYDLLLLDPSPFAEVAIGRYPCPVASLRVWHLIARVFGRIWPLGRTARARMAAIGERLRADFGVTIDVPRYVRSHFVWQRLLVPHVARWLRRYRPKALFWLNDFQRYVVQAAHDANVPVIELQHGATDPLDLNTSYGDTESAPRPTIPDMIFTFGAYWNTKFRSPTTKVVVGSAYIEERIAAIRRRRIPRNPWIVLGISIMDPALLHCCYETACALPSHTFYYKLRPEEYATWRQTIPSAMQQQPNLVMIDTDQQPLLEYLAEAEYVISSCSTALYEGIACGAQAIVFQGWYHEMVADLVAEGWALTVAHHKELAAIVTAGARAHHVADPTAFYADHSLDRFAHALDQVVGRTYVTHQKGAWAGTDRIVPSDLPSTRNDRVHMVGR